MIVRILKSVLCIAVLVMHSALQPDSAWAQATDFKQIKLTEANVKGYIAAQPDLAAIDSKIQASDDAPDPVLKAELDGIAKKHGFADFDELDTIAANISIIMAGLDPETGTFSDPLLKLQEDFKALDADASVPADEKKQLVDMLTEAIKATPKLEFKENIDVVTPYRDQIEKALE